MAFGLFMALIGLGVKGIAEVQAAKDDKEAKRRTNDGQTYFDKSGIHRLTSNGHRIEDCHVFKDSKTGKWVQGISSLDAIKFNIQQWDNVAMDAVTKKVLRNFSQEQRDRDNEFRQSIDDIKERHIQDLIKRGEENGSNTYLSWKSSGWKNEVPERYWEPKETICRGSQYTDLITEEVYVLRHIGYRHYYMQIKEPYHLMKIGFEEYALTQKREELKKAGIKLNYLYNKFNGQGNSLEEKVLYNSALEKLHFIEKDINDYESTFVDIDKFNKALDEIIDYAFESKGELYDFIVNNKSLCGNNVYFVKLHGNIEDNLFEFI